MPTLKEVADRVNFLLSKGDGGRKCHFGLVDVEAKERKENPKGRTRFIMECDCADTYSAFNAEKDRYIEVAGNKSVALSIMLRCWQQLSDMAIRKLAEDESTEVGGESLSDA
jgi:hypothetical protein